MPQGTVQLNCKICGAKVKVPWGKPLSPLTAQCSFGCYEIYPGVLSWNARQKKLKILRASAVVLLQKYRTYDNLVRACQWIEASDHGGNIHVSAIIGNETIPALPKRSRKSLQKVNS